MISRDGHGLILPESLNLGGSSGELRAKNDNLGYLVTESCSFVRFGVSYVRSTDMYI